MKCIIAGSREIFNRAVLDAAMQLCPFTHLITEVVCGGATGIDALGDQWAWDARKPVQYFLITDKGEYDFTTLKNVSPDYRNVIVASDWRTHHDAGPRRNEAMAQYAEALIALPLWGKRKGTDSMLREAKKLGLMIFEREHVQ